LNAVKDFFVSETHLRELSKFCFCIYGDLKTFEQIARIFPKVKYEPIEKVKL